MPGPHVAVGNQLLAPLQYWIQGHRSEHGGPADVQFSRQLLEVPVGLAQPGQLRRPQTSKVRGVGIDDRGANKADVVAELIPVSAMHLAYVKQPTFPEDKTGRRLNMLLGPAMEDQPPSAYPRHLRRGGGSDHDLCGV